MQLRQFADRQESAKKLSVTNRFARPWRVNLWPDGLTACLQDEFSESFEDTLEETNVFGHCILIMPLPFHSCQALDAFCHDPAWQDSSTDHNEPITLQVFRGQMLGRCEKISQLIDTDEKL